MNNLFLAEEKAAPDKNINNDTTGRIDPAQKIAKEEIRKFEESTRSLQELREEVRKWRASTKPSESSSQNDQDNKDSSP